MFESNDISKESWNVFKCEFRLSVPFRMCCVDILISPSFLWCLNSLAKTKKEEIQPTNFCCSSMFILHSFIVTCFMTNALKLTGQNKQIAKHAFISSVAFSIVNDTTRNPCWLALPASCCSGKFLFIVFLHCKKSDFWFVKSTGAKLKVKECTF